MNGFFISLSSVTHIKQTSNQQPAICPPLQKSDFRIGCHPCAIFPFLGKVGNFKYRAKMPAVIFCSKRI